MAKKATVELTLREADMLSFVCELALANEQTNLYGCSPAQKRALHVAQQKIEAALSELRAQESKS